jgi:hypothetical protein
MQHELTRLVGLEGFEVKGVIEVGDQLDLEVELVARAGLCPGCGRASLEVKERPRVRVRDLPLAGRRTGLTPPISTTCLAHSRSPTARASVRWASSSTSCTRTSLIPDIVTSSV